MVCHCNWLMMKHRSQPLRNSVRSFVFLRWCCWQLCHLYSCNTDGVVIRWILWFPQVSVGALILVLLSSAHHSGHFSIFHHFIHHCWVCSRIRRFQLGNSIGLSSIAVEQVVDVMWVVILFAPRFNECHLEGFFSEWYIARGHVLKTPDSTWTLFLRWNVPLLSWLGLEGIDVMFCGGFWDNERSGFGWWHFNTYYTLKLP